jgi:uncharacterized membrane protein
MFATAINFLSLLSAALVVGTMFGVWLTFNPKNLGAATYVAQQQRCIRSLNVIMPLLGGVTVLLTVVTASLSGNDRTRLGLLAGAAVCFVAAGVITRFANQRINAVVMTWSADAPPADWTRRRDDWWRWHIRRMACGLVGLCLLIAGILKSSPPG